MQGEATAGDVARGVALITLRDTADWAAHAADALDRRDVPAAVYAAHTAVEHATEARNRLIELLAG
jgi:hypothetical protein